ncbi:MAG: hypothetical protein IKM04_05435 [Clostridia bacterium]|nr:hypothetical protein [Clostridia bacterium]
MKKRNESIPSLKEQYRANKWLFFIYAFLRLSVVGILIAQVLNRDYLNVALCALTLVLFFIPSFIERRIKVDIPDVLEVTVLLFIYAAEILGEIREYYVNVPHWDTMLHTVTGFLCAAIGIALIDLLNRSDKVSLSLSPLFVAIFAFCFSMTIGIVWEFFEFGMDKYAGMDMQKDTYITRITSVSLHPDGRNIPVELDIDSVVINGEEWPGYLDVGLRDTMKDLFVNFIGATVFSVIGYFYIKNRGQGRFAKLFIPRKKE